MMKCKLLLLLSVLFVAISIYNDRAVDNSFAHTDEILEQLNLKNGLESIFGGNYENTL